MPSSACASVKPLWEVWLNDLSLKPPSSETMQALKPAPRAAGAPGLSAAGGDAPPVPGASAQLVRVRAAAQTNAPTSVRCFFTYCLLGERVHNFLRTTRPMPTLAARGILSP